MSNNSNCSNKSEYSNNNYYINNSNNNNKSNNSNTFSDFADVGSLCCVRHNRSRYLAVTIM